MCLRVCIPCIHVYMYTAVDGQQWMDSSMGHPMDPRAVGMLLCKYSGAEWSLCVHFTYGRQKIPVPPYFLCHTRVVPDVCVTTSFVRGKLPMRLSVHDHVVCEADDARVYQCTCMCSPTLLLPTHPLATDGMTAWYLTLLCNQVPVQSFMCPTVPAWYRRMSPLVGI